MPAKAPPDPVREILDNAEALVRMLDKSEQKAKLAEIGALTGNEERGYATAHEWLIQRLKQPKADNVFRIQAFTGAALAKMNPAQLKRYRAALRDIKQRQQES